MKTGDVFYCRQIIGRPGDQAALTIHGLAIGLMIGHIKPTSLPPSEKVLNQLIGGAGLVKFDDVRECLGGEAMAKLMDFVLEKYSDEKTPDVPA
jgi:hypothetical protein